jgi:hypothetical protein
VQLLNQSPQKETVIAELHTVLRDEVVKQWFSRRSPKNAFERRVGALIVAGKTEQAVRRYVKQAAKDRRNAYLENIKNRAKSILRKILGK